MSSEINPTNNKVIKIHDYHQTQVRLSSITYPIYQSPCLYVVIKDISRISEQNADNENEMVNLGYIANSSRIDEQKQLRPDQVWEHFESHKGVDGTEWAICKYCMKKLVGLINSGSKHLENHLERCRKKRNIGDRGEDHNAADQAGNWSTNPILLIEQSWMDRLLMDPLEDEIRTIIKDDPTSLRLHSIPADQIIQVYKKEKERFRTYLEDLSCRYCLKFEIDGNYFSCSVQFINENWEMREKIISLRNMEEDGNILKFLKDVLLEWGIDKNISSIRDCRLFENDRNKYVTHFNEMERWFSNRGSLPFAGKLLYLYSFQDLAFYIYNLAEDLETNAFDNITAIFNYVKKTSSAEQKFQIAIERAKSLGKEVTAEVIPEEEVYEDWSSKKILEVAIGYKEAFFELENIDTDFKSINFTEEKWDLITPSFNHFSKELNDLDLDIDRYHRYRTANMAFVLLCGLYTSSLTMENFHLLFDGNKPLYWLRDFMEDYWSKNNMVLAAAAVLDPRFKLEIVEHWYKKIYGSEFEKQLTLFKDYFTDVCNEYARLNSSEKSPSDSSISYTMLDLSGRPCKSGLEDVPLRKSEIDLYLKEFKFPSIGEFDILYWWRVNNQYFPALARMARDFLSMEVYSIGVSTTPPFDLHNFLFKLKINGFDVDVVGEALMCTNSWLKSP